MEELINKECKITVSMPKNLYYNATIKAVTKKHIVFRDRENRIYAYDLDLIKEINEV